MAFQFISTAKFVEMNSALALGDPPSWTRLEPQSTLGDPRPGIEARVHDPLWLIGRQWQLGEFRGEDAGTPLTVQVITRTRPVDRWAPLGDREGEAVGRPFARETRDLLEPTIEREPSDGTGPGLRARAESGAVLLAALDDEGLGDARAAVAAAFTLDLAPAADRALTCPCTKASRRSRTRQRSSHRRGASSADTSARSVTDVASDAVTWSQHVFLSQRGSVSQMRRSSARTASTEIAKSTLMATAPTRSLVVRVQFSNGLSRK